MSLKDAPAGTPADGVLDAGEQGEDHPGCEHEKALQAGISQPLKAIVERQFTDIKTAQDEVKSLRNAHR